MSAKGSELKRVRQAEKARVRNKSFVSKVNTAVKKVLSSKNKKWRLISLLQNIF